MRLFIVAGVAAAPVLISSCGGSEFTGPGFQELPDASAGGSLAAGGSSGNGAAAGAAGTAGSGGDTGGGGDVGRGGDSGSAGGSGSAGAGGSGGGGDSGSAGASGTGAAAGSGGVVGVDAEADGNCTSPQIFFPDVDGDGFGTEEGAVVACSPPLGTWSHRSGDCNDAIQGVNPEQTGFFGAEYEAKNGLAFDYNCDGLEEADPSQFGRAPVCGDLNVGNCRGAGFAPMNRSGSGIDPLCGSVVLVECKPMGVLFCDEVITQVGPKRCR